MVVTELMIRMWMGINTMMLEGRCGETVNECIR